MMTALMITTAALAGASNSSTMAGPAGDYDLRESEIVVEARSSPLRDWTMPELDFAEPDNCLQMIERQIPGFGSLRIGPSCPSERSDQFVPWL